MNTDQPSPTKSQIDARVRRFAALRAAQRALAPSVRSPEALPPLEPIRAIRDQLRALLARNGDPAPAEPQPNSGSVGPPDLVPIDGALDGYAYQLRYVADNVAVSQFRASLPELAKNQREEVIALLDLILEDEAGIASRLDYVDYLMTLLCTAHQDGVWRVVVDPPNVSELTRQRSLDSPLCAPDLEAEILRRFTSAAQSLTAGGDTASVVRETAAYKREIVDHYFLPEVLRCIVSYNLAGRLLREKQLSQVRAQDREVDLAPQLASSVSPQTTAFPAAGAAADTTLSSVFDAPGLSAIDGALERRLSRADPLPGPATRIAERLDTERLQPAEVDLLTHPPSGELAPLMRRIVVIGLIAQDPVSIVSELVELGIEPELVRGEWVREICEAARKKTSALVADNGYDDARILSELQSRILIAPLLAEKRRAESAGSPKAPAQADADAFRIPVARPTSTPVPRRVAQPTVRKRVWRRVSQSAIWKVAGVVALIVAGAYQHVASNDPRTVRMLTSERLAEISPVLVSGYRSLGGRGDLFIGTLGDAWHGMKEPARRELGAHMWNGLIEMGVFEIMLFDRKHKLQVHYVGEFNKFPGWKDSGNGVGGAT